GRAFSSPGLAEPANVRAVAPSREALTSTPPLTSASTSLRSPDSTATLSRSSIEISGNWYRRGHRGKRQTKREWQGTHTRRGTAAATSLSVIENHRRISCHVYCCRIPDVAQNIIAWFPGDRFATPG